METYAFDIEIFPNFFSAIFINVDNTFDEEIFIVYKDRNDLEKLKSFVNRKIMLVGYNSIHFDNVILNGILEGEKDLYDLGSRIIDNKDNLDQKIFRLRYKRVSYKSLDFKEMIGLDISLKQVCVTLEWDRIQDLPFEPNKIIEDEDVEEILSYNRNDILPLIFLYGALTPELNLRRKVADIYGVDVFSKSEGQLSNPIFEKLYSVAVGLPIKSILSGRTFRDKVKLGDCVGKNIGFKSKELSLFFNRILDIDLMGKYYNPMVSSPLNFDEVNAYLKIIEYPQKKNFEAKVNFGGLVLNLGVGGMHTQDSPSVFYSDSSFTILDADVTSFYPKIVLLNSIKPAHISDRFLEIFESLIEKRVVAKKNKDKMTADVLKITINAVFGKMGCDSYWLYDPLAFYSVTISGQLYILMLVEDLILNGIDVISANTDGLTSKLKRGQEELYYSICKKWCNFTKFDLEFSEYEKYIRRDVNNYIVLKKGEEIKRKGIFETKEDSSLYQRLRKSYSPDIIPQALTNYFLYGTSVLESLETSKNIFDFLMSQRVGKQFDTIYRNGKREEKLQKTNRFYAAKNGGELIKRDKVENGKKREIGILCGVPVRVANNIDRKKPFEEYQVNLEHYRKEIEKIINTIEKSQLELF